MPWSSSEGKSQARAFLREFSLSSILDIGVGAGGWYDLLSDDHPNATWHGIEIFPPYVSRFDLEQRYDKIFISDARDIPIKFLLPRYDLAIFGDVIEHMKVSEAVNTVFRFPWTRALISVPIVEYPQGELEGNPYETHISTWSASEVETHFPVYRHWCGPQMGVFLLA